MFPPASGKISLVLKIEKHKPNFRQISNLPFGFMTQGAPCWTGIHPSEWTATAEHAYKGKGTTVTQPAEGASSWKSLNESQGMGNLHSTIYDYYYWGIIFPEQYFY